MSDESKPTGNMVNEIHKKDSMHHMNCALNDLDLVIDHYIRNPEPARVLLKRAKQELESAQNRLAMIST